LAGRNAVAKLLYGGGDGQDSGGGGGILQEAQHKVG